MNDYLTYFLGTGEEIIYRGKPVWAWQLLGSSGVYLDELGRVYVQRWLPKGGLGKTPRQRARKTWLPGERRFACYPEGIISAGRGLRLARLGAEKKYIPTFQRIKEIVEDELREGIITKSFFSRDGQELNQDLKKEILKAGFVLSRAQAPELQESFVQLYFLVDIQGRANVGAALARAVAITDRLQERLKSIYAWLSVFSGREQGLVAIEREFRRLSEKLGQQLKIWNRHQAMVRGRTSELQQKLLNDKLIIAARNLRPFTGLRPFGHWISSVTGDLEQAALAIKKGDCFLAKAILERIKVSLEIKNEQKAVDNFLEEIQSDLILGRQRWDFYFCRLKELQERFKFLAAEERLMDFIEPVCQRIAEYFGEAISRLGERKMPKIIGPIKKAYQLL